MEDDDIVVGHRRGQRWIRVGHGLHRQAPRAVRRAPEPDGPDHRARRATLMADLLAWQRVLPRAACFTHLTAAAVWGLWLPPVPPGLPTHLCLPKEVDRPRRPELRTSRLSTTVSPVLVGGVRVAPAAETLLACARDLGLLDLVVLLDSALRQGLCTLAEVEAVAGPRRRGAPALREALRHADARAESPWESVLRTFHLLCGVRVVPQHEVYDDRGVFVARGDLWLRGTRTIHEYDGAVHRDRRTHVRDLARERALTNAGWARRGYTASDLLGRSHVVLREVDATLGRPHRPGRLEAWRDALQGSLFSHDGRAAFARRWSG